MADSKITALTALTSADPANDMIPIVDVSDTPPASGNTKRISINNILAASGTATLASATITGDLTVDTNVLKVDTTNNKVGIGTTTLASTLTIRGTLQTNADYNLQSYYKDNGSTWLGYHLFRDDGVNYLTVLSAQPWAVLINGSERYRIAADGVATWSNVGGVASTAMTLNANGLGIGVTPSAWGAGYKALQLGNGLSLMGSTINGTIAANAWFDGTNWKYISANSSAQYYCSYFGNGSHVWTTSTGVPSAGGTVSYNQAMTLDASGRLILLASTTTPATLATNGELTFTATSNTNLRFSYRGSDGVTRTADLTLA